MNISRIFHINVNCRDLSVSQPFYEALGFKVETTIPEYADPVGAKGLGMGGCLVKGVMLKLGDGENATRLDLLEWLEPRNQTPSPMKLSDPGLARIALSTSDIEGDYKQLQDRGVEFLSEIICLPSEVGLKPIFVCFRDPDGNVLELINSSELSNFSSNGRD